MDRYHNEKKVYRDASNPGQSFTTGGNPSGYLLNSFAIQINTTSSIDPVPTGRKNSVRVMSIDENGDTTTVSLETDHIETGTWNAGDWMTWTLDTPVKLNPDPVYGIDIEHITGGNWRNGIPYLRYNRSDDLAGGTYYRKADGDPFEVEAGESKEFGFHIDLDFAIGNPMPGLSITSFTKVGEEEWEVDWPAFRRQAINCVPPRLCISNREFLSENLSQGNPGSDAGSISGPNSSIVTTDGRGIATVRVTLSGGISDFLRAQLAP